MMVWTNALKTSRVRESWQGGGREEGWLGRNVPEPRVVADNGKSVGIGQ